MEFNIKEYADASISYLLLLHREQLKYQRKSFKRTLKITKLKLSLTNKLISLNKSQIQHMSFEELRVLNRQQIFSTNLKKALEKMHAWHTASREEKKRMLEKTRRNYLAKQQAKCAKIKEDGERNENPEKGYVVKKEEEK